ncbi:cell wall-binding repeat-containing protein [Quadrisphaera sp. INWT6]|uniref:cell wall-binding repeat-containing protein n=1 Tax=Quadrisphaera sp. INWT6 TaxID=2596917 RepID=UPI0018922CD1|nr:cell wall-binding repeat-containing protein [Quadrisphaera sp. INWT6]MBF5082550.1 hypothetical protein [Quadrisphaera sp. INWT6]
MSTTTTAGARTPRRVRGALTATLTAALVAGGLLAAAAPAQALSTDRWWGADRHGTAASVSGAAFGGGAKGAVVVNGGSFADALAAAPLAASLRVPLLTTAQGQLPDSARSELRRLAPESVWVVGGAAAVSDDVVTELRGLTSGDVTRLQGASRYDTAAQVAQTHFASSPDREVYVASGEGFADALSAGAASASRGVPLLLTTRDGLPAETVTALQALAPSRITVVGGTSVVSPGVQGQLEAEWPGKVRRIAGDDRYDTAAKVVKDLTGSAPRVLLASGADFPDALAGAALGQPLLLSRPDCLPQVTADAYAALGTGGVTGLGGPGVLSDTALAGAVCAPAPAPAPSSSASASASGSGSATAKPASTPRPSTTTSTPKATSGGSAYYANCDAVRRAGKDPLYRGQPGYSSKLDRDGDGVACER